MARRRKKIKDSKKEPRRGIFEKFKLTESYTSLILGAIVVLIAGILFVSFARSNRSMRTSSVKEIPNETTQESQDSRTSSTYTVKPGDDLWDISENIYQNGYNWIDIAKANKLENPGLIHAGNRLIIPVVPTAVQKSAAQKLEQTPQSQNSVIRNNSITGDTYEIKHGDNLWDIAVRAYGDGFRYPDIAKANNLENPSLIFSGNILQIPR